MYIDKDTDRHRQTDTDTDTHTHMHTMSLETVCLLQPYMGVVYLPNKGTLNNLFTSFEFRPDRRTAKGVDGSQTVAGTWVKDLVSGTSIAS